jgi:predicted DNA-binding mobile mystery protein A
MKVRKIQLQQLDQRIKKIATLKEVPFPSTGWIRAIRTSLGMSLEQMGKKLGVTRQSAQSIEKREQEGAITINALKEVAHVMDLDFVYGFVPKDGSLAGLIDRKSTELARKVVGMASQTMKLEDQENTNDRLNQAIEERTKEFKDKMPGILWD